jgi:hypothetical protein
MHIRVLYTEDCPNAEPTLALVRQVAAQQRLEVCVEGVLVCSEDEAVKLRFLGSPTVQVNGVDADPTARDREGVALSPAVSTEGLASSLPRRLPTRYEMPR